MLVKRPRRTLGSVGPGLLLEKAVLSAGAPITAAPDEVQARQPTLAP